jgi:hypothetical protein
MAMISNDYLEYLGEFAFIFETALSYEIWSKGGYFDGKYAGRKAHGTVFLKYNKHTNIFYFRWKERYFVLTTDYLQCFKKGTSRISEMGTFLYKVLFDL